MTDPAASTADAAVSPAPSWLDTPGHREWLRSRFADVLTFALPSILPGGGFAYQDADGSPMPGRPPQLFLTARMAYASSIGVRHGIPGSGGLASANALMVGHPLAAGLLEQVIEVIDTRLWDESTQTLLESFAPDWSDCEDYRGANANMHGLEAFLAMGTATGDAVWHRRGLAIADRLINVAAREQDWLLPEHFTADWQVLPDYNIDEPNHPFRPYGATFGHSLEWARFLLQLDESPLVESPSWLVEAADELTRRALDGGWEVDGRPGLVYTVDWEGDAVADVRLHWPVCEGIQAAAYLLRRTGDQHWEGWYRRLWDHAARYFIDENGAWRNELDENMHQGTQVWPGRPDVYHCTGALTTPLAV